MFDLKAVLDAHQGQQLDLIAEHINPAFAKVLRTIGYDIKYVRGQGVYLWDDKGNRYIDCLGGYAVFNVGRNHPTVRQALKDAMDLDLPNLLKMGAYRVSGILAKELVKIAPHPGLDTVFFTNSGAEGIETALKYARIATGRSRIVYCDHGFHGLTLGALSCNGNAEFRAGFGDLLPFTQIPFNDLAALERELAKKDVAGFLVEPIQGKGANIGEEGFLYGAAALCKQFGTMFLDDEVQTGFGRTGKMWAIQHYPGLEPDLLISAKALSGGYVPVGAVLSRRAIHEKCFSSMNESVKHSTTFGQNDLAMVAGLATLHVLQEEKLIENSAKLGELLRAGLDALKNKYEMVKGARGKGLLVAIEFQPPKSLKYKPAWHAVHQMDKSLFPQAVLIPLLTDHHILAQVAGHNMDVIKLIPPLVITEADVREVIAAFDKVIAGLHTLGGAAWVIKRIAGNVIRRDKEPAGA